MLHKRVRQSHERAKRTGGEASRYLSAREAAEIAGVLTDRQIRQLCSGRRLYATRDKRWQWRIPRERFLAHIGVA